MIFVQKYVIFTIANATTLTVFDLFKDLLKALDKVNINVIILFEIKALRRSKRNYCNDLSAWIMLKRWIERQRELDAITSLEIRIFPSYL